MFREIETVKPSDLIIRQFRELVSAGRLAGGDRLPSPKILAEQMKVSQSDVKAAFAKMEHHGVLTTVPQSGSYLADIGRLATEMILTLITEMDRTDYKSLLDTRMLLEVRAAELAAEAATDEEIAQLGVIHGRFVDGIDHGGKALDADQYFHLKIAQFSHSSMLAYLIAVITPEILKVCDAPGRIEDGRYDAVVTEHTVLYQAIVNRHPREAATAMRDHLERVARNRLQEWEGGIGGEDQSAADGMNGCL